MKKPRMKRCVSCKEKFEISEFMGARGKETKSCKKCREKDKVRNRLWNENNPDKRRLRSNAWYAKNRKRAPVKKYNTLSVDTTNFYVKEATPSGGILYYYFFIKKPWFDVFGSQLSVDDNPKRYGDSGITEGIFYSNDILTVRCFKCGKQFVPEYTAVRARIQALKGQKAGECHLYCSQECKDSCSVYKVNYDPAEKDYSTSTLRNPEWSRLVKERDNFTCQKCGSTEDVQAHHVEPVALHPELSDDPDNGLTLCKRCHREVHNQDGCGLAYLRNNKVKIY